MTRALFKKQLLEVFAWLYRDSKTGNRRRAKGVLRVALFYLAVFVFLGSIFYGAADALCAPLTAAGLGWLYWCLMGLVALFLGVFGSVFNTYASLYQAKDNDLLLSMPIPAPCILLVRLFGVYAVGLMYELIVMIPVLIVWFCSAPLTAAGGIFALLTPILLSILVLILSAVLGWVVAAAASRLKHKNILTVLISLVFIVVYFFAGSRASFVMQSILLDPKSVGEKMRSILYPLYRMGLAAEGDVPSMLIFAAMVGALFGIVYLVMSHSFLRLATTNRGEAKAVYTERRLKSRSAGAALLRKELFRFKGSANYMLNCGLGIVFMPAAAAALVWKAGAIQAILVVPAIQEFIPLLAAGGICMLATMNDMTAPSISLEGKNLWLIQAMPVSGGQVLRAKIKLHLLLTLIPAIPLIAVVEWLIRPNAFFAVLIPVFVVLFVALMAELGLAINLKTPRLNWTNEIVPIKQSIGVMAALCGGWVIVIALAAGCFLLRNAVSPAVYLAFCGILLVIACIVLFRWLMTKGARILETL